MQTQDRETWIRWRAHQIWESEGEPHGRHDEHWREAAAEYDGEHAAEEPTASRAEGATDRQDAPPPDRDPKI